MPAASSLRLPAVSLAAASVVAAAAGVGVFTWVTLTGIQAELPLRTLADERDLGVLLQDLGRLDRALVEFHLQPTPERLEELILQQDMAQLRARDTLALFPGDRWPGMAEVNRNLTPVLTELDELIADAAAAPAAASPPVDGARADATRQSLRALYASVKRVYDISSQRAIGSLSEQRQSLQRFRNGLVAVLVAVGVLSTYLVGLLIRQRRSLEAQRRTEIALRESETRYRLLADRSTDMIVLANVDRIRRYVSPGSRRLTGYSPDELTGRLFALILHPEDEPEVMRSFDSVCRGEGDLTLEYRIRHRDGHWVWIEALMSLAHGAESTDDGPYVVIIVRDIGRRKAAERDLLRAKAEAEAASRIKSEFLANMSHELRTPLNAVIGFSEIIRDAMMGPVDTRYRDYARDIHNSGQHLLSLINDVLDLSKVEVGRLDLRDEPMQIAVVVDSCRRLIAERATRSGVDVVVALADGLPAVSADPLRIKQILLNLLANAVKFTPAGGRVTISAALAEDGGIEIAVADTGIGMRPADIPVALAPFRQIDDTLTRRFEGTGLGLPLAKKLTELHGGTLDIESAPGVGTTVRVCLPAARVVDPAVAVRVATPA
jgi:PAS domain S-box-containing protein